jgi:hypothetical protein
MAEGSLPYDKEEEERVEGDMGEALSYPTEKAFLYRTTDKDRRRIGIGATGTRTEASFREIIVTMVRTKEGGMLNHASAT